jgi:hypothetical protein
MIYKAEMPYNIWTKFYKNGHCAKVTKYFRPGKKACLLLKIPVVGPRSSN